MCVATGVNSKTLPLQDASDGRWCTQSIAALDARAPTRMQSEDVAAAVGCLRIKNKKTGAPCSRHASLPLTHVRTVARKHKTVSPSRPALAPKNRQARHAKMMRRCPRRPHED
eukprot:UN0165